MINVIVPMCGVSERFTLEDYTVPKFTLDVNGVPMYAASVNSFKISVEHRLTFLVNTQVAVEYNLVNTIKSHFEHANVVLIDQPTLGFADTVLQAQPHVDNNIPSLILCCDQMVEYDSVEYNKMLTDPDIGGSLLTFDCDSGDVGWTYALVDLMDNITRVACKIPISDTAIVGSYHYTDSREMFELLRQLIQMRVTVNGEYYVRSTIDSSINTCNKPWKSFRVEQMIPLGTPRDYEKYQANYI